MKKAVIISIVMLAAIAIIIVIVLGSGGMFQVNQAQKVARSGQHCEAFELFKEVLKKHPNGLFSTAASDGLTASLQACSQELNAAGKPCEAFELYRELDDTDINGIDDALFSQYYSESLMLCSQSDGNDGMIILQQTYEHFCEGTGEVDQRHPAVGIQDVKKIWSPWIYQYIPYARSKNEIFATEPGELRFVLCDGGTKTQYKDICYFDGGYQLRRNVTGTSLSIIDIISGDEVAQEDIFNMDIGTCPLVKFFKAGIKSEDTFGPPPSIDMIKDWMLMQLEGLLD